MSMKTTVKRSRPITEWLKKKENLEEKEVVVETEVKVSKKSLQIAIESLTLRALSSSNKNVQTNNNKTVNEQNYTLRRSARNLPLDKKPVETQQCKEPFIENLPPILFEGSIDYTNDFFQCASTCDSLLNAVECSEKTIVPIGFDLEWPFSFQTGSGKTALAQICLSLDKCFLIHLYNFKKLPASFIALLSHSKVKLVGVNIKNDVWKLSRDFKEFPGQTVVDNNCLDCGPYANTVLSRSCRWSLERLTAYLLKKRISKDPKVRKSMWHIEPLSDAQKLYAATDAYVSLLLHNTMEQQALLNKAAEEAAALSLPPETDF